MRVTTRNNGRIDKTCPPNQDVINYLQLTDVLIRTCFCQFDHCFLVVGGHVCNSVAKACVSKVNVHTLVIYLN